MTRVTVVGGGITGLAAAWELTRSGASVTVLEASDRLGGKILSDQMGGRTVELGPDAFVARTADALQLCRELGLEDELVSAATDQAAVWVGGRLRPLPQDVVLGVPSRLTSVARSRILSPAGVARAALDPLLPRRRERRRDRPDGDPDDGDVAGDRSVGDLVTARLGHQVHDRLVDPLFGGIHAGPSRALSLQAAAPQLAAAAEGRSLVRGVRAQRRQGNGTRPGFHTLRRGLGRLVERLEEELREGGAEIRLETAIESLPVDGADATVVATPAPAAADLVSSASPEAAAELRSIPYASVTITVLVYPAWAFPEPLSGSGFLVPRSEGRLMTACSYASSKWPHWAGSDEVVLRVSAGRAGDRRALEMEDVELLQEVHKELVDALGLTAGPAAARVARWVDAFPQYQVGHLQRLRRIESALRRDLPDVELVGAAYRGLGITTCIAQGRAAAERTMLRAEHEEREHVERGKRVERVEQLQEVPEVERGDEAEHVEQVQEVGADPAVTTSWPSRPANPPLEDAGEVDGEPEEPFGPGPS